MPLDKRIKRRITGRRQKFFAVVLPGFEGAAKRELGMLGITEIISVSRGGIEFTAKINDCYLINLMSRSITRLMLRLFEFRARDFFTIYEKTGKFEWDLYLRENQSIEVRVSASASRLYHTDRIRRETEKGLARAFGGKIKFSAEDENRQIIFVRIHEDRCIVSLDTSGDHLYRRGYKSASTAASIRETTAASILIEADIYAYDCVSDPMCGSGTFALEAVGLLSRSPAALNRKFPFEEWPCFSGAAFAHLKKKITEEADRTVLERIKVSASDIDPRAVISALTNRDVAGFCGEIKISERDFFFGIEGDNAAERGLLLLNPPYGERLRLVDKILFYKNIGETIRSRYAGWSFAVIVPGERFERAVGLRYSKKIVFSNGGIRAAVLFGQIKNNGQDGQF